MSFYAHVGNILKSWRTHMPLMNNNGQTHAMIISWIRSMQPQFHHQYTNIRKLSSINFLWRQKEVIQLLPSFSLCLMSTSAWAHANTLASLGNYFKVEYMSLVILYDHVPAISSIHLFSCKTILSRIGLKSIVRHTDLYLKSNTICLSCACSI